MVKRKCGQGSLQGFLFPVKGGFHGIKNRGYILVLNKGEITAKMLYKRIVATRCDITTFNKNPKGSRIYHLFF